MLNVYVLTCNKEIITTNDAWFDLYTIQKPVTEDMQRIIKEIDEVAYVGDGYIEPKFGVGRDKGNKQIPMENLSTGCKTALNIFAFTDKVFFTGECGMNAYEVIMQLSDGNIFIPTMPNFLTLQNSINLILDNKQQIIRTYDEFFDIMDGVF